jgi:serine/threonine protein kinase
METALENSVWVISPEFAGYLTKRGFHWRKLWKKRWVALHGSEIAYMAEEPNDNNTDDLIVTKAQITSATVVDREDLDGHPHGFAIHINDGQSPTWYLRAESTREKKSWLMRLGHVHTIVRWLEEFEKVRVLGVGGTGIVYELLHNANGQRYAMKEMEIKNKSQMQMAVAEAEMLKEIMENISHPNIMHIEKVFQVRTNSPFLSLCLSLSVFLSLSLCLSLSLSSSLSLSVSLSLSLSVSLSCPLS